MEDFNALYARRGEARNGSPYASDRTFKRRESVWVWAARMARDLLAVVAFLVIVWAILSPLAS